VSAAAANAPDSRGKATIQMDAIETGFLESKQTIPTTIPQALHQTLFYAWVKNAS